MNINEITNEERIKWMASHLSGYLVDFYGAEVTWIDKVGLTKKTKLVYQNWEQEYEIFIKAIDKAILESKKQ